MGYYRAAYNYFLIDYILFFPDARAALKQVESLIDEDFCLALGANKGIIEGYPKDIQDNLDVLLKYVQDRFGIESNFKRLENNYDKYLEEFNIKMDDLEYQTQTVCIDKDTIRDSICFDFANFANLTTKEEPYMKEVFPTQIFNDKYIYFVKKMFRQCPKLLLDERIIKRLNCVLKYNVDSIAECDKSELKNELRTELIIAYARKNGAKENEAKNNFEHFEKKFEKLLESSKKLIEKLENVNVNNCGINFRSENLEDLYGDMYLDMILVSDEKADPAKLKNIYKYIDSHKNIALWNDKMKRNALRALAAYKDYYAPNWQKHNEYIRTINGLNASPTGMILYQGFLKKKYLKTVHCLFDKDFDKQTFQDIAYDFNVLDYLVFDKPMEFDKRTVDSLEKIRYLNLGLFANQDILKRLDDIPNSSKAVSKMKSKIIKKFKR